MAGTATGYGCRGHRRLARAQGRPRLRGLRLSSTSMSGYIENHDRRGGVNPLLVHVASVISLVHRAGALKPRVRHFASYARLRRRLGQAIPTCWNTCKALQSSDIFAPQRPPRTRQPVMSSQTSPGPITRAPTEDLLYRYRN